MPAPMVKLNAAEHVWTLVVLLYAQLLKEEFLVE
jgi:hypothetical protein